MHKILLTPILVCVVWGISMTTAMHCIQNKIGNWAHLTFRHDPDHEDGWWYYCGKQHTGQHCTHCNSICGPNNGCQCPACAILNQQLRGKEEWLCELFLERVLPRDPRLAANREDGIFTVHCDEQMLYLYFDPRACAWYSSFDRTTWAGVGQQLRSQPEPFPFCSLLQSLNSPNPPIPESEAMVVFCNEIETKALCTENFYRWGHARFFYQPQDDGGQWMWQLDGDTDTDWFPCSDPPRRPHTTAWAILSLGKRNPKPAEPQAPNTPSAPLGG
eukprot:TRINITY_DN52301_c0_g3_i1.p1 TRINITY_DN52301_c0_g3~~TRINITY_DN52301_c0_g3_i1.p1  ORF type:complete len:280 (-),score=-6.79 TRINITY_DN52301_c0_g3_i1:45-863(-)